MTFLWKKDFIKRSQVIQRTEKGGLGLVDVQTKVKSLKASWLPRMLKYKCSWRNIPNYYIKEMGLQLKDIIKANTTTHTEFFEKSMFYKDVFEAFYECKDDTVINGKNIFAEIVWLNKTFSWKEKVLFHENWAKSGFMYLKDFYDKDGIFVSERNVLNKLTVKRNWIQEYMKIRSVLNRAT